MYFYVIEPTPGEEDDNDFTVLESFVSKTSAQEFVLANGFGRFLLVVAENDLELRRDA